VIVSIHKNYTDYSNFIEKLRFEAEGIIKNYDTLLISLNGFIAKPFSLKHLAKLYEEYQAK